MDEQNIHQFWGFTPSVDLLSLRKGCTNILQVSPYDPRHTIQTICQAARHDIGDDTIHLYVYEDTPEALARHILLIGLLFDSSLLPTDRVSMFLEVFGNLFLREETKKYLQHRSKQLENVVSKKIAGSSSEETDLFHKILDLSLMRYEAKDQLLSAIVQSRTAPSIDVKHAWDTRSRKWYGDRYDFRKNAGRWKEVAHSVQIDWDYHMRLVEADAEPPGCHIIHFSHYRHWRMTGLAYEVRDCQYNVPNSTLISTAVGRTKEFKNTKCEDVGRSVVAKGLWCDILCSPYHSFGVVTENKELLDVSNKQYKHTAVDISRHNLHSLLREVRGEAQGTVSESLEGAKPSRGPTTAEDLQEAMKFKTVIEEEAEESCEQQACAEDASQKTSDDVKNTSSEPGEAHNATEASDSEPVTQIDSAVASTSAGHTAHVKDAQEKAQEHQAKLQEQQKLEKALNDIMQARVGKFRVHCVSGDFVKQLSGKRVLKEAFKVATVGVMHAHLLRGPHKLADTLAPGAVVLVEGAQNLVQVKQEALKQFGGTLATWARESNLRVADPSDNVSNIPPGVFPFIKDNVSLGG